MLTLAALQRMSLGLKLFHFRSIKGFCCAGAQGRAGTGSVDAHRTRWKRHLHNPCGQEKVDEAPSLSTLLLPRCKEWEAGMTYLCHALNASFCSSQGISMLLRLLLCLLELSERILLLPSPIPSCPSPVSLAHLELGGLQKHLDRSRRSRKQKLDHFYPIDLL